MKIVILASGRGTNFKAITTAVAEGNLPGVEIAGLVCNKADAPVLEIARVLKVATHVHASKPFYEGGQLNRDRYEDGLLRILKPMNPDYLVLAGYTLLLGKRLLTFFPNRIVNIHPSLLPAFKGLRAQKQALDFGAQWTGCTVHLVTEQLDAGPIIRQEVLKIEPGDTEDSLTARLLEVEHRTYVAALRDLAKKKLN